MQCVESLGLDAVPANGMFLRTDACRRAASDPILGGESDFSADTREADLGAHSDPGEPRPPRRESPQDGSEAAARCPVTGGLGRGNRSGSCVAEAVAYVGSGRLLSTGLTSRSSSGGQSGWRRSTPTLLHTTSTLVCVALARRPVIYQSPQVIYQLGQQPAAADVRPPNRATPREKRPPAGTRQRRAAGDRAGPRAMELYGEVVAVKGAC
jgi:hypothetical protein